MDIEWHLRDWLLLNKELSPFLDSVVSEWTELINSAATRERDCLNFLQKNAGLFFLRPPDSCIVLSEVALGSDYRIDFVIVSEGFSAGTHYELIEIESPNEAMYTKKGKTSARLSGAIDQMREWRRWISNNRSLAQKIFPSSRWKFGVEPAFSYKIVIGRREESLRVQDKIWSKMHDSSVSVVSFDRLTDRMKNRFYGQFFTYQLATENHHFKTQPCRLNLAACPFFEALSDTKWRQLNPTANSDFGQHLTSSYLTKIVAADLINKQRLFDFDAAVAKLTGVRALTEADLR